MKWDKQIEINAPIENVWELFSVKNMKRIMPQVVSIKVYSQDPKSNTTVYEETYREGNRDETYLLTEINVKNTAIEKIKRFSFTIANMIHTEGEYTFKAISEKKTLFVYKGENTGVSFFGKIMLKMAGKLNDLSVVNNFMALVKKESEK